MRALHGGEALKGAHLGLEEIVVGGVVGELEDHLARRGRREPRAAVDRGQIAASHARREAVTATLGLHLEVDGAR